MLLPPSTGQAAEEASVSWKSVTGDFRESAILFTVEGEPTPPRRRQMIIKGNLSRRIVNAAAFYCKPPTTTTTAAIKMVII